MQFYINNLMTVVPMILIMILLMHNPVAPVRKRRYFFLAVLFTLIESVMEVFDRIMISGKLYSSQTVTSIINVIGFLVGSAAVYFLFCLVIQNTRAEGNEILFSVPLIIDIILCFLSIWFPIIFHIDKNCNYSRGMLFEVHLFIVMLYYTCAAVCDIYKKRRYLRIEKICVIACYALSAVAFFIQIIIPQFVITWNAIGIMLIFYYIVFLSNAMKHDTLTGIFNRRMFDVALNSCNRRRSVTIVNIDVNNFKELNDLKGHDFGDNVLSCCAATVQRYFEKYGFAYRVGGDEFCVICTNIESVMIEAIFENIEIDLAYLRVQTGYNRMLSYGIIQYNPSDETDIYKSVTDADTAMYEFKNRIKFKK